MRLRWTGSATPGVLALLIDWVLAMLTVILFVGPAGYFVAGTEGGSQIPSLITLPVFVAQSALLTAFCGGSFGKVIMGLRIIRADGQGPVGPLRALARSALIALVIPPLVFQSDSRGLHDVLTRTAPVRMADLRAMGQS